MHTRLQKTRERLSETRHFLYLIVVNAICYTKYYSNNYNYNIMSAEEDSSDQHEVEVDNLES